MSQFESLITQKACAILTQLRSKLEDFVDPVQAAVITISDKGYAGKREDVSGPLLVKQLERIGAEIVEVTLVPDDRDQISQALVRLADELAPDLIITTGGTGPAPRDITPEATLGVIDREMPGIAEALRQDGRQNTPLAVISRGVAGLRGNTLIINLPGNPKAVIEGMRTLAPIIPHTVSMIRGGDIEHTGGNRSV